MAKGKGKEDKSLRAKDGAAAERKRPSSDADATPSFSDAMVASLTKRIEQKLKGDEGANGGLSKAEKKEKLEKNDKRKERNQVIEMKPTEKPVKKRELLADVKPTDNKAGKKRDRSGKIIQSEVSEKPHSTAERQRDVRKNLEEEVYAIGGTKEDLDLVAGVESDSEMEDKEVSSGDLEKLRSDLGKLINGGNELPEVPDLPMQETKPIKTKQERKQEGKQSEENRTEKLTQEKKSKGNNALEKKTESKKIQKNESLPSALTQDSKMSEKGLSSSISLSLSVPIGIILYFQKYPMIPIAT
ncbi:uncharacterized protein TERG_12610 [Trichophyton rubrum CBS 118892]|uniref:Uncharacterized protein n=1 Tax=Trichophyton rubrum (strain ATCC MYA-4607 / CBS 118892) TaxID=559305 RepID=A0A080WXX6_TRIRC|nr:uncharacterized protein TERG_12610 [Trichophyton rubrum CBS 118892]KFL62873.1 hypothetical protein TERG_12610 [Trichophyton rubrum CBS 118892]